MAAGKGWQCYRWRSIQRELARDWEIYQAMRTDILSSDDKKLEPTNTQATIAKAAQVSTVQTFN